MRVLLLCGCLWWSAYKDTQLHSYTKCTYTISTHNSIVACKYLYQTACRSYMYVHLCKKLGIYSIYLVYIELHILSTCIIVLVHMCIHRYVTLIRIIILKISLSSCGLIVIANVYIVLDRFDCHDLCFFSKCITLHVYMEINMLFNVLSVQAKILLNVTLIWSRVLFNWPYKHTEKIPNNLKQCSCYKNINNIWTIMLHG